MNTPLVSVIIPIYNVEKYIHSCIGSVLEQTYENLEILLVDDGSLDNSASICDEYALLDNRVKVIHKENGGLSDARNCGLHAARGEYIHFLDGDDYIEHILIEKAVKEASENNADVIIWGYYADFVTEHEILQNTVEHRIKYGIFDKNNLKEIPLTEELIGILGYAWNKLYLRSFLIDNNFSFLKGLSLIEDITFNSPVLSCAKKIVFLEEPLIHYMQRPRKTLGSQFYENFFELNAQACMLIHELLKCWEIDNSVLEKVVAYKCFNAIKATIIMLTSSDNISKQQKKIYLDGILNDSETHNMLKNIQLSSLKNKIVYRMIKMKKSYFLLVMYKLFRHV
nr:glycosyltransferase family 2 protein [uncultured Trichococcus sp.]